jgi:hypothetical protein
MVSHQLALEKGHKLGYHVWTVPDMLLVSVGCKTQYHPTSNFPLYVYLRYIIYIYHPMTFWLVNVVFSQCLIVGPMAMPLPQPAA